MSGMCHSFFRPSIVVLHAPDSLCLCHRARQHTTLAPVTMQVSTDCQRTSCDHATQLMQHTLPYVQVIEENRAVKKEKWVKDNQGQLIITAGQVVWTTECEKALADPDQAKAALRHLKKKWISYLNKLTAITCSKLTKIERNKVCDSHATHCPVTTGISVHLLATTSSWNCCISSPNLPSHMHAGILMVTG